VTARFALILMIIAATSTAAMSQAQSQSMIGKWKVDITFGDGDQRSLRFNASDDGKGTFELLDPRAKVWGAPASWEARWTRGEGNSVMFSGKVEFMLGNVGRDAGTLEFKGKFEHDSSITGEVTFSPLVGDRPSKSGTFKAVRDSGG
jgi:hypothetical protein